GHPKHLAVGVVEAQERDIDDAGVDAARSARGITKLAAIATFGQTDRLGVDLQAEPHTPFVEAERQLGLRLDEHPTHALAVLAAALWRQLPADLAGTSHHHAAVGVEHGRAADRLGEARAQLLALELGQEID